MIFYTAAMPNKVCQKIIDQVYPQTRYMLSPVTLRSFGKSREPLLYQRGYAIDNGAYSYFLKGKDFDGGAFMSMCDKYADCADFIVIPDCVGDWEKTLSMAMRWVNMLITYERPLMMVAQDGCEVDDFGSLRSWVSNGIISGGIFVGGTTEWKLKNMYKLSQICKEAGKKCHVGRVNSRKRLLQCYNTDVDSIDGSGASRFKGTTLIMAHTLSQLDRQQKLF